MKTKIFAILLCMICMFGLVFQSCDDDIEIPRVGLCLRPVTDSWVSEIRTSAEKNLNRYGLTYRIYQASGTLQNDTIRTMLDKGCEVMVIVPNGATEEAITDVRNAGIPLIFVESTIGSDYDAFLNVDSASVGVTAASFFNNQSDVQRIAVFNVTADPTTSTTRNQGLITGLTEDLKDNLVEFTITAYTREAGRAAVASLLENALYSDINAIYAQDDEVALGIIEALEEAESQQIKAIVGCGGTTSFYDAIISNETINLATTLLSASTLMDKTIEVANNLLSGIQPESKTILISSELVDRNSFVVE